MHYDVAIIGAGVIGCAIARALSKYQLKTVVLEKGSDVACGTSKANSGIVHAGYDAKPGTLKARFNVEGQRMFDSLSDELHFPFRRCGSLVTAFSKEDITVLEELNKRGIENGIKYLELLDADALRLMEPNINDEVIGALYVPEGGITCPYEMTIALAENAASNGVVFEFNSEVHSLTKKGDVFLIQTANAQIKTTVLINAAGIYGDTIHNQLSENKMTIHPRKGEYCLLDKSEGALVNHTIFHLPDETGKGILITPTVDGNILVGPTSTQIPDKDDVSTTKAGLNDVMQKVETYVKHFPSNKIITSFAGLRAHSDTDDFIIGMVPDVAGMIDVCGIESPGLTAAPAIAQEVKRLVLAILPSDENTAYEPTRKGIPSFRHMTNKERKALIQSNSDYGKIICRCEMVTKGEILDALHSPLGIRDLDAIKRRTRMGMGRCQSGFCSMRIVDIVADALNIPVDQVNKNGPVTNLLLEKSKCSL